MNKQGKAYEPPMAKVYRFDDNEHILTASGDVNTKPAEPTAEYAANALNQLMNGTSTTIEK